jgi:hypothetical protein
MKKSSTGRHFPVGALLTLYGIEIVFCVASHRLMGGLQTLHAHSFVSHLLPNSKIFLLVFDADPRNMAEKVSITVSGISSFSFF